MSIQDESFPDDEFFNELEFSFKNNKRFQFPKKRLYQQQCEHKPPPTTATASSSATTNTSSSTDQNSSTESTSGRPSSGLSTKTTASDPTGLADNGPKKSDHNVDQPNKARSHQDIHTEYTKRRYKHVGSKVGQYIADMKAQEQKRRSSTKFARTHSLPETLSGAGAKTEIATATNNAARCTMRHSATELRKLEESTSDAEQNETGTTSTSGSTSSRGGGQHESSDDAVTATDFIDKHTFARLINEKERIESYSDYLQTKLDEEISENLRLKRNVDFMRIELSNCEDKLKRQLALMSGANGMSTTLGSFGSSLVTRQSLQAVYGAPKCAKATQTEMITPVPAPPTHAHEVYIMPDTPDGHSNTFDSNSCAGEGAAVAKTSKTVATIQPISLNFSNIVEQDNAGSSCSANVLRQRTNSNASTKNSKPAGRASKDCSGSSYPSSSSDSAIDIEPLPSPKLNARIGREENVYHDKRCSGRHATIENFSNSTSLMSDVNDTSDVDVTTSGARNRKTAKKRNTLRRRWLHIFAPCTRCRDPNGQLDDNTMQQTYTQIPLLEKSSVNNCSSFR